MLCDLITYVMVSNKHYNENDRNRMNTSAGWIDQGHPEKAYQLKNMAVGQPRNGCIDTVNRDATKLVVNA